MRRSMVDYFQNRWQWSIRHGAAGMSDVSGRWKSRGKAIRVVLDVIDKPVVRAAVGPIPGRRLCQATAAGWCEITPGGHEDQWSCFNY